MNIIEIPRAIFNPSQLYMERNNKLCILGAIFTYKGYAGLDKCKTPADLKKDVFPFTMKFRNKFVDSPLTIQLLRLDVLPPEQAVEEANKLLKEHNYKLIIV